MKERLEGVNPPSQRGLDQSLDLNHKGDQPYLIADLRRSGKGSLVIVQRTLTLVLVAGCLIKKFTYVVHFRFFTFYDNNLPKKKKVNVITQLSV